MLKNRIFLSVLSCSLILICIISYPLQLHPKEGYMMFFGFPGILLGLFLFFSRPKTNNSSLDSANELLKWKQLLDSGAISEAEFEKRRMIL